MEELQKKVAIFDVDGTIIRSSLFIELTEAMITAKLFPASMRKIYTKEHLLWLERKGSYEDYIMAMVRAYEKHLKGVRVKDFNAISRKVARIHRNRVYRYTRDLIPELKNNGYFLLAISQSPKNILDPFCLYAGFNKVYGRIYEANALGVLTGKVLYLDVIANKANALQRAVERENLTLEGSIAVGDTEGDIPMLSLVERPICFNPNRRLYEYAKSKGWEVVVERKDMIYKL